MGMKSGIDKWPYRSSKTSRDREPNVGQDGEKEAG